MTDTIGISPLEQYGIYGSIALGSYNYFKANRKAYYLEKYAVEKDPFQRTQWAGSTPLTPAELENASVYAKKFRKSQRAWIALPLVFIGVEAIKTTVMWYNRVHATDNRK